MMKQHILWGAIALAGLATTAAQAESTFTNPAATNSTATARLDFSIVIPQVLFLRVGTSASNFASDGTVDSIVFNVPAANVGDGTAIAGTGGDLTGGAVTVRVYGNGGNISLNSSVSGAMANVAADTIPWSEISVAAAPLAVPTAGYTNAAITHPAFNATNNGSGTATTLTAVNRVVRAEGRWTYSYLNTATVPAGTYGTSARNGRVTYTATQL